MKAPEQNLYSSAVIKCALKLIKMLYLNQSLKLINYFSIDDPTHTLTSHKPSNTKT